MTLNAAADFARFLIRTTAETWERFGEFGYAATGGPIDVVTISEQDGVRHTRSGVAWAPRVRTWNTPPR